MAKELNELTVLELRKAAKALRVQLGAGISKAGIVDKLTEPFESRSAEEQRRILALAQGLEAPAEPQQTAPQYPQQTEQDDEPRAEQEPENRPQTYASQEQRFNTAPSYTAGNHRAPDRSTNSPRRFGPGAVDTRDDERPARHDLPARSGRTAFNDPSRFVSRPAAGYESPNRQNGFEQPRQNNYEQTQRPAYEQRPQQTEQRPAFERSYDRPRRDNTGEAAPVYAVNPTINDLITPVEPPECTGVLELGTEGYGYLRLNTPTSNGKDVYVSTAMAKRFGLRTGDKVSGKYRVQRDGDKYPVMLTIAQINGCTPEALANRPAFEALTAVYPTNRINLSCPATPAMMDVRLVDLIAPIGFGQRALIQCGPRTGKHRLLQHLANVIGQNHPDATVMMMLFNQNPEDVTLIREGVKCQVHASTFDMPPETHLKMADAVLDHAQRLVEMKQNVVLLVDSLTVLSKLASTAAMQQGRLTPGMVNPQSLQKAKRVFGAARCLREGGSLTVLAAMNTDAAKLDEAIISEFRGAANFELVLDQNLARQGLYPPVLIAQSGTRKADAIMTPEHQEALKTLRQMVGRLSPEQALSEVKSMLDKAESTDDLISRIKAWAQSMQG